jgi:hypothetical protein
MVVAGLNMDEDMGGRKAPQDILLQVIAQVVGFLGGRVF